MTLFEEYTEHVHNGLEVELAKEIVFAIMRDQYMDDGTKKLITTWDNDDFNRWIVIVRTKLLTSQA